MNEQKKHKPARTAHPPPQAALGEIEGKLVRLCVGDGEVRPSSSQSVREPHLPTHRNGKKQSKSIIHIHKMNNSN